MSEKDVWIKSYLKEVRKQNRLKMSKCYVCGEEAKWIVAKQHRIYPACREHADND